MAQSAGDAAYARLEAERVHCAANGLTTPQALAEREQDALRDGESARIRRRMIRKVY